MYCTICGYGFFVAGEEAETMDFKVAAKFLKEHRKIFGKTDDEKQILDELDNIKTDDELEELMYEIEEDYKDENSEDAGMGAAIAAVMTRETGVKFQYFSPANGGEDAPAIIWRPTYPWMQNDMEKELTEAKLHDICKKYMDELGFNGKPEELELSYTWW